LKIVIETIPHASQRYETCGDYWTDAEGTRHIAISDTGSDDDAFLIAIHELIEQHLTERRGISEEEITAFDTEFEAKRTAYDLSEPGDDPKAPYQNEHNFATGIERLLCSQLDIPWQEYNDTVEGLRE